MAMYKKIFSHYTVQNYIASGAVRTIKISQISV